MTGIPHPDHDEHCEAEWVTGSWGGAWSVCNCWLRSQLDRPTVEPREDRHGE